jgi:hypothetical protein
MHLGVDLSPGEGGPARTAEPGDGRVSGCAHTWAMPAVATTTGLWGYASSTN